MRIGRRNLEHRGWRMMWMLRKTWNKGWKIIWMGRRDLEHRLENDVDGTENNGTQSGE